VYNMIVTVFNMIVTVYNMIVTVYNMIVTVYNMIVTVYKMIVTVYNMLLTPFTHFYDVGYLKNDTMCSLCPKLSVILPVWNSIELEDIEIVNIKYMYK